MTAFSDNTALMFAEAAKVSREYREKYLSPYTDLPEVDELRRRGAPLVAGLQALVRYSHQIVALNSAPKSDSEKNLLLAEYLDRATRNVSSRATLDELGLGSAGLDSVFTDIRRAPTFLKGIDAASPLITVVVVALLESLDELGEEVVPAAIGAMDRAVESKYREKRKAYVGLTDLQARYMNAAAWLYQGLSGSEAAVDSMLRADPSLRQYVPSATAPTSEQLAAADDVLIERLDRIHTLLTQLETERSTYVATKRELEDLRLNLEERINVARHAIVVWGQSHRNLGMGVPVPPLIDLANMAGRVAHVIPAP